VGLRTRERKPRVSGSGKKRGVCPGGGLIRLKKVYQLVGSIKYRGKNKPVSHPGAKISDKGGNNVDIKK